MSEFLASLESVCNVKFTVNRFISFALLRRCCIVRDLGSFVVRGVNVVCIFCNVQFGIDWLVCLTKPDRSYIVRRIRELLPSAFDGSALQPDRQVTGGNVVQK